MRAEVSAHSRDESQQVCMFSLSLSLALLSPLLSSHSLCRVEVAAMEERKEPTTARARECNRAVGCIRLGVRRRGKATGQRKRRSISRDPARSRGRTTRLRDRGKKQKRQRDTENPAKETKEKGKTRAGHVRYLLSASKWIYRECSRADPRSLSLSLHRPERATRFIAACSEQLDTR